MKLVIEIPEEYRSIFEENRCEEKFDSLASNEFGYVLRKAFENGTPLQKGHGDLIDTHDLVYSDLECTDGNTYMVVHAPYVDNATIIIEADKENKNADCD